jgi:hypothetical protein
MRSWVLAFVVFPVACYGTSPPPPVSSTAAPPPANHFDRVIGELDTIRNRLCACVDDTCADKVDEQHRTWVRVHKKLMSGGEDTASDAQIGRTIRLEAAYKTCDKRFGVGMALKKMAEFKDMMCQCADRSCADHVTDQMTKWSVEMARHADRDVRVSEEDTKQMQQVTEEFTKCATTAMTAGMTP